MDARLHSGLIDKLTFRIARQKFVSLKISMQCSQILFHFAQKKISQN